MFYNYIILTFKKTKKNNCKKQFESNFYFYKKYNFVFKDTKEREL